MKPVLAGLLITLSSTCAADWMSVDGTDDLDAYVDLTTFNREGDSVRMWVIFDYKKAGQIRKGKYLSSKMQDEYDCNLERRRRLFLSVHSGHMGGGKVILADDKEGDWRPIAPKSTGEKLWRTACEAGRPRAQLSGQRGSVSTQ
jgi:hypothetical protein